ncbi:MAG: HD domain-containing protein [Pseudomonadales bacterium]
MKTVTFTAMIDGSAEDYQLLDRFERDHIEALPQRLTIALMGMKDGLAGYKINRLEHSLQAATRAERDGADIEWIVAALLHDLGDDLAPLNHAQYAASIVKPYVRAEVTWAVNMHGLFQEFYYAHHFGKDPNGRDQYQSHPFYLSCVNFCARWDQPSFDPDYENLPLDHFVPMLETVFSREPFVPDIIAGH